VAKMSPGRVRLRDAMDERRLELGLTWAGVEKRDGPTMATLRAIRRGDPTAVSPLTRVRIARALEWERSYVDALLNDEALPPLVPEDVYEDTILHSVMPEAMKRDHIEWYRREGRKILAGKGITPRRLDRAHTGA
jgi:hypothetical protein